MAVSFRYFGSGMSAPFHVLSNFNECRIEGRVYVENGGQERGELVERRFVFPSSEHYWWAHFTKDFSDVSRLAVGGDLSTLQRGLCLMLGQEKGRRKTVYWQKKDNVGIVAKMLAAKKRNGSSGVVRFRARELGMVLGLHPVQVYGAQGEISTLEGIWRKI